MELYPQGERKKGSDRFLDANGGGDPGSCRGYPESGAHPASLLEWSFVDLPERVLPKDARKASEETKPWEV